MTFSQYAGTAIIPTLARIVLGVAFVSAGWNKVFEEAEFTAEQATELKGLNVNVEPAAKVAMTDSQTQFVLASHRLQDAPPAEGSESKPAAPPTDTGEAAPPPVGETSTPQTSPTTEPLAPGMYKAQALHHITLMLKANNVPQPVWMARLAAFTELVGGAMLLLGLFSRIWGLGLAVAMGVAFYLVSMKANGIFTMDPRTFALDGMKFSTAYLQAGLFVLAFGIFLTGAGPLSLDRMLFGGGGESLEPGEVKID